MLRRGLALVLAGALIALGAWFFAPSPILPWQAQPAEMEILTELRLPRVLAGFAVGALLAYAGALFQTLLGNPLAEPYVLGAAGGGAVGAVLVLLAGAQHPWAVGAGAFVGVLVSMAAVVRFSTRGRVALLLAGAVLAAFTSALVAVLLALLSPNLQAAALAWMLGDLSLPRLAPATLWVAAALLLGAGWALAPWLDRLLLGETLARAHGVALARLRVVVLILASLAVGLAVAAAGTIGFVGLVAPHLVRMQGAVRHRLLLPFAMLAGGAFLVAADAFARTVIAPRELPVGAATALVGAPLFLHLLRRWARPS